MFSKSLLLKDLRQCRRILARGLHAKPAWDIIAGICVERLPVITPPLNEMQKKFKEMLYTIEVEKSLKSDHEIRHDNDKVQAELLKNDAVDVDLDAVSKITAQDFEDAATEELAKFKFADIVTEADKTGNKASVERCLQRHLVLVTPHKLGQDTKPILPQGKWQEGETLRQCQVICSYRLESVEVDFFTTLVDKDSKLLPCRRIERNTLKDCGAELVRQLKEISAERVLSEHCGPDLKVQFLSNAPCGFYKYKYPNEIEGKIGAKVFFYYANYKSGKLNDKVKGKWLTRTELTEFLPDKYKKSVEEFLIQESY